MWMTFEETKCQCQRMIQEAQNMKQTATHRMHTRFLGHFFGGGGAVLVRYEWFWEESYQCQENMLGKL